MYRKRHGHIAPDDVVKFLVLDREFPRSIHHCLTAASDSLHEISGTPLGMFRNLAEQRFGQLRAELAYTDIEQIIGRGLHESRRSSEKAQFGRPVHRRHVFRAASDGRRASRAAGCTMTSLQISAGRKTPRQILKRAWTLAVVISATRSRVTPFKEAIVSATKRT
jgi:hypothetical protein